MECGRAQHRDIGRRQPYQCGFVRAIVVLMLAALLTLVLNGVTAGAGALVFLARGEESYSLHAGQKKGQKVDEQYRVDKVTENRVTFTYLPLKIQQTLEIPAVN